MTENRQEEEHKSTFLSNRPNLNENLTEEVQKSSNC